MDSPATRDAGEEAMSQDFVNLQRRCNSENLVNRLRRLPQYGTLDSGLEETQWPNESIIGTASGVRLVRSIRRLVPSQKYAKTPFEEMKGTPWSLRGTGGFQQLHFPGHSAGLKPKSSKEGHDGQTQTEEEARKEARGAGAETEANKTEDVLSKTEGSKSSEKRSA